MNIEKSNKEMLELNKEDKDAYNTLWLSREVSENKFEIKSLMNRQKEIDKEIQELQNRIYFYQN